MSSVAFSIIFPAHINIKFGSNPKKYVAISNHQFVVTVIRRMGSRMRAVKRQAARAPPRVIYPSVSEPPGRGPVPGPGINYTGPREVLLEFVILVF